MKIPLSSAVPTTSRRRNSPFVISGRLVTRAISATIATLVATGFATCSVFAAAPQVRSQAPGFYRMMLGDFEITVVCDGTLVRSVDEITSKPEKVRSEVDRDHESLKTAISVNTYLINTGEKLVLLDTGAGELFKPEGGKLITNLRAAGYEPGQVDVILLTHMHADHSGGLTVQGERLFPNALVFVDQREVDYWLDPEKEKAAPASQRLPFQQSRATVNPYVSAKQLRPFDGKTEILPGIHSMPAYGHTPGHTAYLIESRGQKLVLWGDIIHFADAQFTDPSITVSYDVDPPVAAATRRRLLEEADREGLLIGSDHISFPGLGHVRADGQGGFRWITRPYHDKP